MRITGRKVSIENALILPQSMPYSVMNCPATTAKGLACGVSVKIKGRKNSRQHTIVTRIPAADSPGPVNGNTTRAIAWSREQPSIAAASTTAVLSTEETMLFR